MFTKPGEGQSTPKQPMAGHPPAATTSHFESAAKPTVLGKSIKIVGEISSDEEMYLDGDLEGKLELNNRLTIGPASKVKANIKAKEVVVFGSVRGNVEAEHRIALRAGATIVGDIKTAGIVIEDGAYFKGGIDISRPEPLKAQTPAPAAARAAGAAAGDKK